MSEVPLVREGGDLEPLAPIPFSPPTPPLAEEALPPAASPAPLASSPSLCDSNSPGFALTSSVAAAAAEPCTVDPADFLTCSLCLSLFHDPVTLTCGHSFCRDCAVRAVHARPTCALCRAPVSAAVDTAPPSHVLATLIAHHWPVAAAARAREIKAQRRAPRLTYGVMVLASGALHFPGQTTKLFIYEPRYRVMVNRVMPTHRSFVITSLDSLPASVAQMIHLDGDWGEHDSFPARARGRGPSSVAAAAGLYDHGPRSEPAAPPSAVAAAAALGSESAGVSADSSSAAFDPASAPAPATAPDAPEPEPMGVMFHILTCRSYPDGRLVVRGECRERVTLTRPSIDPTTFGLLVSEVQPMEDLDDVDDHPDLPAPEHAQGQQEGAQQQQEQQHGDVQSAAAALGVDPVAEEADADAVAAGGLRQRRVSASTNAGPSDSAGAGAGASAGAGAGAGAGASAGRSAIVSAPAISADDAGQAADAAAAAVAAAAASGHTTPHAAAASAATVLPGVLSMISLYFDRANVPLHRIAERFGDVPSDPVRIPFWVCTAIPGSDDLKLLCLRSRLHTERLLIADAILRAGLRGGGFFSRFSGQKVLLTAFLLLVLYKFFTGPQ